MSRKAKRARAKERRRERLAQAQADAEVREEWLAAVHGDRADLELLAREDATGRLARRAVLAAEEVPDGVTETMLLRAVQRALEAM